VRNAVNSNIPFAIEYERIFGRVNTGKIFCPFHNNTKTPAAKIYSNGLYCFSCRRLYGTYDLLLKFDKERLDELLKQLNLKAEQKKTPLKYVKITRIDNLEQALQTIKLKYENLQI